MNKKMSKRQRDMKTKLMAAICMLLVSSIMMVSTTYAWFTLSTAPEVTGINTAVGANGNLEMALLPTSGSTNDIESDVGDSIKNDIERNITWGNLVDLSDTSYGLDQIAMYPAALNLGVDGNLNKAQPLKFPTYGADGRVDTLKPDTLTGIYDDGSFSPDSFYGVRAVGSASGMSDRQLSYRNARSNANTAKSYAKQLASLSLQSKGSALASIAVKKGTDENPKFTKTDIETLEAIVDDLIGKDGILDQINNAYMQYILAYAASAKTGTEDLAWQFVKSLVEATNADINTVLAGIQNPTGDFAGVTVSLPGELTAGVQAYNATREAVDNANELLADLTPDADQNYSWGQISPILSKLADPDAMQINGVEAGKIMDGDNMNTLVNSVLGGAGVNVIIAPGGGVYADIAEQTENFEASVKIEQIKYGTQTFGPVSAKMKTAATSSVLGSIGNVVEAAGAPTNAVQGEVPITDMYGYVIDLAFRTNAASSNLVLQTEAVDRIYTSNNAGGGAEVEGETTMGNGANMTFRSINPSFSNDSVVNLMKAIRVVFFNPDNGQIVKYALLNTTNTSTTADGGIKANLELYDYNKGGTQTVYYMETVQSGGISYDVYFTTAEKTEKQYRMYKTTTGEGTEAVTTEHWERWELDTDGSDKWTEVSTTMPSDISSGTSTSEAGFVKASDNKIMALTQNSAHKLSALVYLDGEQITNKDVASNGAKSVTGTMNLQFSSDANLTPMNYTPLMVQGDAAATSYTVTVDGTEEAEKATAGQDFTYTPASGKTVATVSVNGTALTASTDYTVDTSTGKITIPANKVTGNIAITLA